MRGGVVEVGFDDNLPRTRLTNVNSRARAAFATMSFVQTRSLMLVGLACTALALALGSQGCGSPGARSFDEPAPALSTPPQAAPGASVAAADAGVTDAALDATPAPDPAPPGVGLMHTSAQLDFMRAHATQEPWASAYQQLLAEAEAALARTPQAKADFDVPFYYGQPAASQAAKEGLRQDALAAYALALGYQLAETHAKRVQYADKAITLLDAWATINKTVSGADGNLVVLYTGIPLLYAGDLVMNYGGWNQASRTAFVAWVGTVFANSAGAIKDHGNNWGDWGTLGAVASAGVLHDTAAVLAEVERIKARIANDIDASGELPEENKRTNSGMWYTFFALTSMTTAAQIALNVTGADLFAYTAPNGRTIRLALDKELFYATHADQWPYHLPAGVAGDAWRQLYPCADDVEMPTPTGWPGNLFEIMSDVYKVQAWEDWVAPHRPERGYHGWIYATLARRTP